MESTFSFILNFINPPLGHRLVFSKGEVDNKYCMECFKVDDLSEIVFFEWQCENHKHKSGEVVTLWPSFIFV